MTLIRVSMRELNSKSSEMVRRAIAGDRVVVTNRGTPVAEITPVRSDRQGARKTDVVRAFRGVGRFDRGTLRRELDEIVDEFL